MTEGTPLEILTAQEATEGSLTGGQVLCQHTPPDSYAAPKARIEDLYTGVVVEMWKTRLEILFVLEENIRTKACSAPRRGSDR